MKSLLITAVPSLLTIAGAAPDLGAAEVGGMSVRVHDALTGARLNQVDGSGVVDYDSTDSMSLYRVGNTYIFSDTMVNVRIGGYAIGSYATDYIPIYQSGIMVQNMTTTYVTRYHYHPVLTLTLSSGSAVEGGTATATITLKNSSGANVSIYNDMVINLTSSDPSRVSVPASVTIPANVAAVSFTVTAVDNAVADGNAAVTIGATRGTWGSASIGFTAISNE